jgi:CBS domain-containing protein
LVDARWPTDRRDVGVWLWMIAGIGVGRAIRLMAQHGFRRLPVVNADPAGGGQVVGVLTRTDIIRWLSDADRATRHAARD